MYSVIIVGKWYYILLVLSVTAVNFLMQHQHSASLLQQPSESQNLHYYINDINHYFPHRPTFPFHTQYRPPTPPPPPLPHRPFWAHPPTFPPYRPFTSTSSPEIFIHSQSSSTQPPHSGYRGNHTIVLKHLLICTVLLHIVDVCVESRKVKKKLITISFFWKLFVQTIKMVKLKYKLTKHDPKYIIHMSTLLTRQI